MAPMDPLMAALTDEEPPQELRDDAEYRAAVTDVALLRAELQSLGDTLGRAPQPRPEPAASPRGLRGPRGLRSSRSSRGRRPGALLALAAACAAALLGGVMWLGAVNGVGGAVSGDDRSAGAEKQEAASTSAEGTVACARLIVEGTVAAVESLPGAAGERITLDVIRSYKPADGEPRVTFVTEAESFPRLRTGDRVLIIVPKGQARPSHVATGEDVTRDRAWIERALPGARGLTCDRGSGDQGPGDQGSEG
ncbi:hypothetical protein ACFQVC_14890 [Streptomyces monticola]|uniref:DUF5667 domain-containing protein n=1 Tax=Streptomyces monticola TaxID=2666263 RepID=A0ABW2JHK3_9ACTN